MRYVIWLNMLSIGRDTDERVGGRDTSNRAHGEGPSTRTDSKGTCDRAPLARVPLSEQTARSL